MKKQIVLETLVVPPFTGFNIKEAPMWAARFCRLTSRGHLDIPPNGDMVHKALEPKLAAGSAERRANHPQRILVVEDEAAIRQIYCGVLAGCGFQVDTAEDGEAGWNVLQSTGLDANGYDLLVTDNKMPRLSGVELIQRLHSAHIELPVILASGALPASTNELRVAAILSKPFPLDLLVKTVKEVLHVTKNE